MSKPTLQQIAARAKVSPATVDRVLHGRAAVSEKTRTKVESAVKELGYGELPEILLRAAQGSYHFVFLLPYPRSGFTDLLAQALQDATAAFDDADIDCTLHRVSLTRGSELVEALDDVDENHYQGVGVFAIDAPGVKQAIGRAVARGLKVVTLVSDIPDSTRHHFVGIDNVSAGRVVASLMGRFIGQRRGTIAVISGSQRQRDQIDRYFGFRQVIEERFPELTLLPVHETDSVNDLNRATTSELLKSRQDMRGLYSMSAGNVGILAALREHAVDPPVVIMHELSDPVRSALATHRIDAVVAQNTDHIARSAMRVLRAFCDAKPIVASQERIRLEIFLADNIP